MWLLVGLHAALLVVASVVYPTYRAPDEVAHVAMVLSVAEVSGYPEVGDRISRRVQDSMALVGHQREEEPPPLETAGAPPREERPAFADLGPDVPGDIPQQMAAHPPLYYAAAATAMSVVTTLVPAAYDWSFDQIVGFLRLFSAALVAPLPLLAFKVADRLRAPQEAALAAAVLPLGVPQLTHIGASVNNDTLLLALLGVLTLLAVAVARGDTSARTAAAAGVVGGLALLTKGFALIVPVWLAAVYALAAVRAGRRALATGALALGVTTLVGGWWWLRNLAVHGTVQPAGLASPPPPEGFTPDVAFWLWFYLQRLSVRFWVEPNILPDGIPPVHLLATLAAVVLCAAAFVGHRQVAQRPADIGAALLPLAGLAGIVTFGAWRVYARSGQPFAIHGRYLYGAVVGVAVVAALGAFALLRAHRRWLPLVALATVLIGQLAANGLALTTYWGPSGLGARVAALLAWSPWPPAVVAVAAVGAAALAAWTALTLLEAARAQGGSPTLR